MNKVTIDKKLSLKVDAIGFEKGDTAIVRIQLFNIVNKKEEKLITKDFDVTIENSQFAYYFTIIDFCKEHEVDIKKVKYIKGWIDTDGEVDRDYDDKVEYEVTSCYCNRDFTVNEVKNIVKELRKTENIKSSKLWEPVRKSGISPSNKSYETTTDELNQIFNKYNINTCLRKIHFLAQTYHETDRFRAMTEYDSIYTKKYDPYRGRGLVHLTHNGTYKKFSTYMSDNTIFTNPSIVATNIKYAFEAGGWFWEKESDWGNLNNFSDNDDIYKINIGINGGFNGFKERIVYIKKLIKFTNITNCKNIKLKKGKTLGVYKFSTSSIKDSNYGKRNRSKFEKYDD